VVLLPLPWAWVPPSEVEWASLSLEHCPVMGRENAE
jgi:hypothetical protein